MPITFKPEYPDLQRKYGRQLQRLISERVVTNLSLLDSTDTDNYFPHIDVMTDDQLEKHLLDGEGVYWSLKFNSNGDITRVKPYTRGTVCKHLHRIAKRETKFNDVMLDFTERL